MGEPKAFASLSSGLLARKGAARPAMRPQGFGQLGAGGLDDLGWNDMGFEAPQPSEEEEPSFTADITPHPVRNPLAGLTPIGSPVHDQQDEIEARFTADEGDEDEAFDEDYDDTAELCEDAEEQIAALSAGQADETLDAVYADQAPTVEAVAEPVFEPLFEAAPEPVFEAAPEPVFEATPEPVFEAAPEPVVAFIAPVVAEVPAPRRATRARSAPGSKAKAAFTLRLDKARHLKLRLACAVTGRSAQQMVTDALDAMLAAMPELDSMAGHTGHSDDK